MFAKCMNAVFDGISRKKILLDDYSGDGKLKKCLKTFDLIAIGVSCTLGSGIYVLTGEVAKHLAGPAIIFSFLIAAVASILSGMCYAEFATRIPKSGSAYVYTYITVGEMAAFFIGWNLFLEYVIGSAVIARAFSAYLNNLSGGIVFNATHAAFGHIDLHGLSKELDFLSFGVIIIFSILLSTGVKNSSILNNILTVINIAIAIFVVIVGAFFAKGENWRNFAPFGVQGIIAGASTCFFAFIGFDVIATTAEEANNPSKSIPRSIIGTICICFVTYFLMSAIVTLMVPYQNLNIETAVADAFSQVNIKWASYFVNIGAGISMLGCTLVSLFPLPRLLFAMSEDGLIPLCFSKLSTKTNSPVISTLVGGLCSGVVAMVFNLQSLVEMLSIGTLLAYTMVDLCVVKLRYEVEIVDEIVFPMVEKESFNIGLCEDKKEEEPNTQAIRKPNTKQNNSVLRCLFFILVNLIVLAACSVFHKTMNLIIVCFFVIICLLAVICTTFYIYKLPQSDKKLVFEAPLVPFLPIFAVFTNIYLMMELRHLTWIRLIVWMSVGIIVYFAYSIRHSVAIKHKRRNSDEEKPLIGENVKGGDEQE